MGRVQQRETPPPGAHQTGFGKRPNACKKRHRGYQFVAVGDKGQVFVAIELTGRCATAHAATLLAVCKLFLLRLHAVQEDCTAMKLEVEFAFPRQYCLHDHRCSRDWRCWTRPIGGLDQSRARCLRDRVVTRSSGC